MESLKIFIVETTHLILSKFHTNIPWVDLYLIPSRDFDPLENIGFFFGRLTLLIVASVAIQCPHGPLVENILTLIFTSL